MEIPEGWPTEEMLIAARLGIKESKAMREISDEWFTRKFKAALAAAPTPPAQEDEPDYWLIKSQDHDDPFLVDNKDTLELYLNAGLKLEAELYARPQSDELRRAAEEVYALVKDNSSVPIRPVLNLKAALEKK